MKKKILIAGVLLFLAGSIVLSACSTAAGTTGNSAATAQATSAATQAATTTNSSAGQPPSMPAGSPPNGALMGQPPSNGGTPQDGAPPGGSNTSADTALSTASAAYKLDNQTATQTGQTYTASNNDESAVYVLNGGSLQLSNSMINTSGNTSSQDSSSFYGLNAAVLATAGSSITLTDSSINTTGTGANGAFATGTGSSVTLSNAKIDAKADGAHGVMATNAGTVTMDNVDITTAGGSSSAIATDRGGGTITVTGGNVTTSGQNSAGIYSTGNIAVSNGTFASTGAEAAVIEGANSITLNNTSMTSNKAGKWGVMIYQSMSGDAEGAKGEFTMTGGSLSYTATDGPLFYVTNTTGIITLKGAMLGAASGTLISASAGNWGTSGSNGGTVMLTADGQTLNGNLVADNISSISATLKNSSALNGSINTANTAKAAELTLDASSTWNVTTDSYISCLSDSAGISGTSITNITGNGHTVYYSQSSCSTLGGQTYALANGGYLKPAE